MYYPYCAARMFHSWPWHLGRPATPLRGVNEIEALPTSTDLSIRQIQGKIAGKASRGIVGEITKRARAAQPATL